MLQQLIDRLITLYDHKAIAADDPATIKLAQDLAAYIQKTFMPDPNNVHAEEVLANMRQHLLDAYVPTWQPEMLQKILIASKQLQAAALEYSNNHEPIGGKFPIGEAAAIIQSYWIRAIEGLISHHLPYLVPQNVQRIPTRDLLAFLQEVRKATGRWNNELKIRTFNAWEQILGRNSFISQDARDQYLKEIIATTLIVRGYNPETSSGKKALELLNNGRYSELKAVICTALGITSVLTYDDLHSFIATFSVPEVELNHVFNELIPICENRDIGFEDQYETMVLDFGKRFFDLKNTMLITNRDVVSFFRRNQYRCYQMQDALNSLAIALRWHTVDTEDEHYNEAIDWWQQKLASV